MSILIIGSANLDLIMQVDRLPQRGETVTGGVLSRAFGGKGANQAVAAARAGGRVTFVGCLGQDDDGDRMAAHFEREGLDIDHLRRSADEATGTALILVDPQGHNMITVAPGANYTLRPADVESLAPIMRKADMLVLQCELDRDTLRAVLEQAYRVECPVMLNLAPAKALPPQLLRPLAWLIVNETEAAFLTRQAVDGEASARQALRSLGHMVDGGVVLTLGEAGSLLWWKGDVQHIPAFEVEAVDSTAAGDVYCGVLAVGLVEGLAVDEAVAMASAAAALAVTKLGAQPSAPDRQAIDAMRRTKT